jgi:hypothetical protein
MDGYHLIFHNPIEGTSLRMISTRVEIVGFLRRTQVCL